MSAMNTNNTTNNKSKQSSNTTTSKTNEYYPLIAKTNKRDLTSNQKWIISDLANGLNYTNIDYLVTKMVINDWPLNYWTGSNNIKYDNFCYNHCMSSCNNQSCSRGHDISYNLLLLYSNGETHLKNKRKAYYLAYYLIKYIGYNVESLIGDLERFNPNINDIINSSQDNKEDRTNDTQDDKNDDDDDNNDEYNNLDYVLRANIYDLIDGVYVSYKDRMYLINQQENIRYLSLFMNKLRKDKDYNKMIINYDKKWAKEIVDNINMYNMSQEDVDILERKEEAKREKRRRQRQNKRNRNKCNDNESTISTISTVSTGSETSNNTMNTVNTVNTVNTSSSSNLMS